MFSQKETGKGSVPCLTGVLRMSHMVCQGETQQARRASPPISSPLLGNPALLLEVVSHGFCREGGKRNRGGEDIVITDGETQVHLQEDLSSLRAQRPAGLPFAWPHMGRTVQLERARQCSPGSLPWVLCCSPKDILPGALFHPWGPQVSRKPHELPLLAPLGFEAVMDGSRVAICFLSRKHKQFNARREGPCSLLAAGRSPRSSPNVMEAAEKGKQPCPWGLGTQGDVSLVND